MAWNLPPGVTGMEWQINPPDPSPAESAAYGRGGADRRAGVSLLSCPYEDEVLIAAWRDGWQDEGLEIASEDARQD